MPKSRRRKKSRGGSKGGTKGTAKRRAPSPLSSFPDTGPYPAPPVSKLVDIIMGSKDLVDEGDPMVVEMWASQMLRTFYKVPLPLHVRDEFEKSMTAELLHAIDHTEDDTQMATLRALSAVAPDPIGRRARARADQLAAQGTPDPPWVDVIGRPDFLDAWTSEDPYGDQRMYIARFRYPGRDPHTVTALYDVNMGGIVKDAFVGYTRRDLKEAPVPHGMARHDAEAHAMASEILAGIAMGDIYIDNDWTDDFKNARALLAARMRPLVDEPPQVPPDFDPLPDDAREELIREFMTSDLATGLEAEASILHHCMVFRCDYSDGDPFRWSPIGVELFMVGFLPRKATLDTIEVRNLPRVLKAWIRFSLTKRGLEERWIQESEDAVDRWTTDFRKEVTNPDNFGTAKAIGHAMMADGVDFTDQPSVDQWMREFNERPFEERDEFLRDR